MWDFIDKLKASRKNGVRERQYNDVDYTQLTETDNGFVDSQYVTPPLKIPWRPVGLAAILLITAVLMLVIGGLVVSGRIESKYSESMWPVIVLGLLMLVPLGYQIKYAIRTYHRAAGYTFEDIPEFE